MLIESILKRPAPPVITLFGQTYAFKADARGRHVCEVADPKAIHRLTVEIAEGYRPVNGKVPAKPPAAEPAQTPLLEPAASQEPAKAVNANTAHSTLPASLVLSNGDAQVDIMTLDGQALRALAANEFDIQVHPKWSDETVRLKIVEATRRE